MAEYNLGSASGEIVITSDTSSVEDLNKALGDTTKAAEEVDRSTKTAAEAISSKLSTAGKGLTAGLTVPIVAIGAAALNAAMEIDGAFDTIRVGTGATGDTLAGLEQSFANIAGNVPADLGSISTALADLNTRLGITGPTLETLTSQVLEAGRMGGAAIDVGNLTAAFSAFGVEGEDTTAMMDRLFTISQATGVPINNLTALMAKSGAVVAELGLDFDSTAAFIGNLDKAGIDSGAVMSSLQRSLVNLAKDGEAPADAFKRVTGELQTLVANGDDAAALDLAGSIFGTRGAPQFLAALKSGAVNLNDLGVVAGESTDTILGLGEATADFPEQFQVIKNQAMLALEPIGKQFLPIISGALEKILPLIKQFADWLGGLSSGQQTGLLIVGAALAAIGPALYAASIAIKAYNTALQVWTAITKVGAAVQWLLNAAMSANPIGLIIIGIFALVAAFIWLWNNVDGFRNFFIAVWEGIKTATAAVINWFTTSLPAWWNSVVDGATAKFNSFLAWWHQLWASVGQGVATAWEGIKNFFGTVLSTILNLFLNWTLLGFLIKHWDTIRNTIVNVWNGIVRFFASIPQRVLNALSAIGNLHNSFRNWIGSVRDAAVAKFNELVSWVGGIPGRILSALGSVGTMLYQSGKNIVQGLIDGIRSMVTNVGNAISGVVQKVRDFLPFSPAKEGPLSGQGSPDIAGRKITEMIASGVSQGEDALQRQMEALLSASTILDKTMGQASGRLLVQGIVTGARDEQRASGGVLGGLGSTLTDLVATSAAGRRSTAAAQTSPTKIGLRVMIGSRDITDIVQTEILRSLEDEADAIMVGAIR